MAVVTVHTPSTLIKKPFVGGPVCVWNTEMADKYLPTGPSVVPYLMLVQDLFRKCYKSNK